MPIKKKKAILYIFLSILFLSVFSWYFLPANAIVTDTVSFSENQTQTLWKDQCIDTMKTSRDRARSWISRDDLKSYVSKEMSTIKDLGANCVALDTPYDKEFVPYLRVWVAAAREKNLRIWFRGNFSSWEGWFDYPKGMSTKQLLDNTKDFIASNSDLFADGDIFTAAPEAENGGPFNQVDPDEYETFRNFLIDEHTLIQAEFKKQNKKIQTHWLSMNGGLARRMFDSQTLEKLNNTVTIDHYVKTPAEMSEYIAYFKNKFHAKTIVGEFGAPIPDITGEMTDAQQAKFIDELFQELYLHRDSVDGINYWILTDGSTELVNAEMKPRPAASVVKAYFKPSVIRVKVTNTVGENINGATIKMGNLITSTEDSGLFEIIIPTKNTDLAIEKNGYKAKIKPISLNTSQEINYSVVLEPEQRNWFYTLQLKMKNLLGKYTM